MTGADPAVGTFTLCAHCHHAIEYRRQRIRSAYGRGRPYIDLEMWEHTEAVSKGGPWHEPEPRKC